MSITVRLYGTLILLWLFSCNQTSQALINKDVIDNKLIERKLCLLGCPVGIKANNILIDHNIFILSSDRETKFADWVAYRVTKENLKEKAVLKRVWKKDLNINSLYNLILSDLESEIKKMVKDNKEVYVLTGPYYDKKKGQVNSNIVKRSIVSQIPSGYWIIISTQNKGRVKTIGFSFAHSTSKQDNYCRHIKSSKEIEDISGLRFFPNKVGIFVEEGALAEDLCFEDYLYQ